MKCEDLKQGNNALLIQTVKITTTLCVFLVNILYTRHVFENKDPNVNETGAKRKVSYLEKNNGKSEEIDTHG